MWFCSFVCSSHLSFPCWSWRITLPSAWLCFCASTLAFAILCHAEASCAFFLPSAFFQLDTGKRDPSTLWVLQHFPILLVNMGTVLTQHPIGHGVVTYPWVLLLPVWLELQLFPCSGTFAVRNLSSLCIFWQCSWWNFRSGLLWLCGIRIITLWSIIANIFPLLAVHWCG